MNRIYRVVWNRVRCQWVAASEIASSHSRGARSSAGAAALPAVLLLVGGLAFGGPAGAQLVGTAGGNASGSTGGTGYGDGLAPGGGAGKYSYGPGGGNGGNGGGSVVPGGGGGGAGSGGGGGSAGNFTTANEASIGGIDGGAGAIDPVFDFVGGGGGGSGGAGHVLPVGNTTLGGTLTGGAGGNGAAGSGSNFAGGGGGGGGGMGAQGSGNLTVGNGAAITGGAGGVGGAGLNGGSGGGGGGGGHGVDLSGAMLVNRGTITGGNGGLGGAGSANSVFTGWGGAQGRGGDGVRASDGSTVRNAGTGVISGGLSADGTVRANAVTFTGDNGTLIMESGASFVGQVQALGSGNAFVLGGFANGSFDLGSLGTAFTGFGSFRKIESSTWTLTGAGAQDWSVEAGTLAGDQANLAGNLDIAAGATVHFAVTVPAHTRGAALSGVGTFIYSGPGELTLVNDNAGFSGSLVANSLLRIGDGGTTGGIGTAALANNAGMVVNRAGTLLLGGTISGGGSLTQAGPGTTTLSGNNTYTGGTFLNAGTLRIGHDNALGTGLLTIANGTTLESNGARRITNDILVDGDFSIRPAGTIPGVTAFELDGNMDLGGAQRTITNPMNIDAGQFGQVNLGGAISNGGITFADAGFPTGGNAVFFRMDGAQANTYTGDTIVGSNVSLTLAKTAGVTSVGGNLTIRPESIAVVLNSEQVADTSTVHIEVTGRLRIGNSALGGVTETIATLTDDGAGTAEVVLEDRGAAGTLRVGAGQFTGIISGGAAGTTSLEKMGPGTLVLAGNHTYAGDTVVTAGTLQVGNGGTSGSLGAGNVTNEGLLVFRRSDDFTVANLITGTGGLRHTGPGTLTLTNSNSYTGGTLVQGGTLYLAHEQAAGGGAITLDGGELLAGSSSVMSASVLTTAGTTNTLAAADSSTIVFGSVTAGANSVLRFGRAGDTGTILMFPYGSNAAGAGVRLQVAGGTVRDEGGFAQLAAGADRVTVDGGAHLELRVPIAMRELHGAGAVSATHILQVGGGLFSGSIIGGATLAQTAGGTFVLSGTNTYSGGTTVAGTLQVGNGGTAGTLGSGTVTGLGGTLAFDRSDTHTVANRLTGDLGLAQRGTGTTILTGANDSTGRTRIEAGVLQVGDGGTSGSLGTGAVTNDGTLAFARSDTLTVGNAISGTGNLRQAGTGTTRLAGSNTYTGTTRIAAGTLQVGAGGTTGTLGAGAVANDGALAFDRSDTLLVNNTIGGSGRLLQQGSGTTVLAGANTYAGTTTISDGALIVGNGGTAGSLGAGAVVNDGTLAFARSNTVRVGNAISGSGEVLHQGTGTTILTGANTYAGATTIAQGTLQVGNGGTAGTLGAGAIANDGVLRFRRSDTLAVANAIRGNGVLVQAGSGTLVLSGNNGYTGGTFVDAGTLRVDGAIRGAATVADGATLAGGGRIGSATVRTGGALQAIGTLAASGNLHFEDGATFRMTADAAGNNSRVDAAGTIRIDGGTVDVAAGAGRYARNTTYTILRSGGATTGRFDGVATDLAFLTPTLAYQGDRVLLRMTSAQAPRYGSVATTRNQRAVAAHLQSFADEPDGADAADLITDIDNLDADQARLAFATLAGSQHAGASQLALAASRSFAAALAARGGFAGAGAGERQFAQLRLASLAETTAPGETMSDVPRTAMAPAPLPEGEWPQARGLWAQALGSGGRTASDGNAAGSEHDAGGFVLGYEQRLAGGWTAGGAIGHTRTNWDSDAATQPGSGRIDSPQAGLYARYAGTAWRVHLDAALAQHRFHTSRDVIVGTARSTASSTHDGQEWSVGVQVEYPVQWNGWNLRPLAGLRHARLREDGFTETGAGAANLSVAERRSQTTVGSLGLAFGRSFAQAAGGYEFRAIASHLGGSNDSPVRASVAGQAGSFTAAGVPLKRNALTLGASMQGRLRGNLVGYLDTSYEVRGSGQNAYQLTAGVRWGW